MFAALRRRRSQMACRRATELMTNYIEGVLSGRDRTRFETHLANCAGCVAYLDQMRATIATVGGIDADDVPAEVMNGLLDLYRRSHSS